jgi:hypothetical protein
LAWGCGLDSTGSGQGPVASCSCATELVSCHFACPMLIHARLMKNKKQIWKANYCNIFVSH